MTTITQGFDGLVDGAAVTTSSYGSGTAPNAVIGSVTADAARAVHGDMGGQFDSAGASTAGIQDTTSLGTLTVVRGRSYTYIPAVPAANLRIFQVLDGTTLACSAGLNTAGRLRLVDSAFTQMAVSGISVPLNQVVRIEWRFVASTTAGQATARVWFSPESTGAPDIELISGSTFNTRASWSRYDSGISFSTGQTYTLYLDEIAWTDDDSGEIGPYEPPPAGEQTFSDSFETGFVGAWDLATNADVRTDAARQGSYGVRLDSSTSFARLRLDTVTFGATRRWAALRCWVRWPQGAPTEDVALVRWRNTDPSAAGGGGNGDIWLDSADQTLRGDLQPGDFFLGPAITANAWYQLSAVCAFVNDGTSSLKVRLNGTEIANITSTINDPGQTLAHIEFGTLTTQDDIVDLDGVTITVSDTALDYLDDFQTGTLAATLPAFQAAAAGAATAAGTAAVGLPAMTASATGDLSVTSALTATMSPLGASASGTVSAFGQLAATMPALSASASGAVLASGPLAATMPSLGASAAGDLHVSGAVGSTMPALSAAAVGQVSVTAGLDASLPALSAASSGVVDAGPGLLAVTMPPMAVASSATASVTGSAAVGLPAMRASAAGLATVAGPLAVAMPPLAAITSGQVSGSPEAVLAAALPALAAAAAGASDAVDTTTRGSIALRARAGPNAAARDRPSPAMAGTARTGSTMGGR